LLEKIKHIIAIIFFSLILFSTVSSTAQEKNETEISNLLDLSLEQLLDINIVSATKEISRISEVPATVRVITAEEIAMKGCLTLEDALSDLPGFQFRNIQGFNSYVFQRGVPSQNNTILVLVDGIQVNELNSGGFYGGGQYNLTNVERIEVVYGPASVLYGTNAISGIVNIVTKDFKEGNSFSINTMVGTFNTFSSDMAYAHYDSLKKFGVQVAGMYKTTEKANLAGSDGDNQWSNNMENFENDYAIDVKVKYKNLILGANVMDKNASRTTNYKTIGGLSQDFGTNWHIRFTNTYLKYELKKSDKISYFSSFYYRNSTVMNNSIGYIEMPTDSTDGFQVRYYRPNSLIGTENRINIKINDKLKFIAGIVFEHEQLSETFSTEVSNSYDIEPIEASRPVILNNFLGGIFAQGQFNFFKYFSLSAGIRNDNSNYSGNIFTPRFGLTFHKQSFSSRLLFTNAYRAPKPWDYYSGVGNLSLEPERMYSLEFSNTYFIGKYLKLDASIYRNLLYGVLSKEVTAYSYRWVNEGELLTNGFETSLSFRKKSYDFYLNYTYNSSLDENNQFVPEISKQIFNLGSQFTIKNKFVIGLRGNYIGKRENLKQIASQGSTTIAPAFVTNFSFMVKNIKNVNIQFLVKNLFDVEYYHTSNNSPDWYRQAQQQFLMKISYII